MAYRSWLKDVRSIHDLGEHCHSLSFRKPEDEDRDVKYDEKWLARLRSDIPVAPEFQFAFGTRMHDSWIEWVKRTSGEFRIRVNNDLAQEFMGVVTDKLDIHVPTVLNTIYGRETKPITGDWLAPVDLVFHDPAYVNAVRTDASGHLKWAEWEDIGPRRDRSMLDQFLYDWFFEQDERIQCIIQIWSPMTGDGSSYLYLLMDCSKATAQDYRAQAISQTLSPLAAQVWTDMVSGDSDYRGWPHIYEYVENRLQTLNRSWDDLRPNQPVKR